jgi:hypothetical protein
MFLIITTLRSKSDKLTTYEYENRTVETLIETTVFFQLIEHKQNVTVTTLSVAVTTGGRGGKY